MPELNKKDVDIVNVLADMERADEVVDEKVDLFDSFTPETPFSVNNEDNKKQTRVEVKKPYNAYVQKSEVTTTVIGSTTNIQGDIVINEADLEFHGRVTGNITVSGDLSLLSNAVVEGNIIANSIVSDGEISVTGDIKIKNEARIEHGTYITGNLSAKSLELGGSIKGNSEISSDIYAKETACFDGNIITGSLRMEPGAQLCGQVQIKR